jgi:pSer/pThr/pTyr-binding forkhead associated (FHA) protein
MKLWLQNSYPLNGRSEIAVDRFPFLIGRRSDNDLSLPWAFISRRHCQFTQSGEEVLVQDLESYNGTYVNGRRASVPLPVRHGDELNLGPLVFRVVMPRTPHETAEACQRPTNDEFGCAAQRPTPSERRTPREDSSGVLR